MEKIKFLSSLLLTILTLSSFAQQNPKIGDIYTFEDNTKGIVFYVDENGKGLALSLDEANLRWENESHFVYCQDIVNIPNEKNVELSLNMGLGKNYTAFIINQLGENKAPSAKYSRAEGSEWYLPSAGELYQLFSVANAHGEINKILISNNHKPLNGWYWTSSEYNNGEAWRINRNGKVKRCSKLALRVNTRAIRQF